MGGCASRPGTCHPALLGRMLDYPVINLGFSGNGKMEGEVAELLAEHRGWVLFGAAWYCPRTKGAR